MNPPPPEPHAAGVIAALEALSVIHRQPEKDYFLFVHETHWPSVEEYAKDLKVEPVEKDGHTCYFLHGAFTTKAHPAKHIQGYGQ